ncbi:MAG TPA: class I SAM-dependent methyltransferase, partial [Actinomycetota bacterium]|nr:class I SAM-dependent methyltransferase [Actinomycetota bacterium]
MREPERRTLEGQIEYYRRRAQTGSDPWITRAVREEATYAPDDALGPEESEALRALEELDLRGNILELACGTGAWTEHLVPHASRVTAVDASPEILEVNRARVGDP